MHSEGATQNADAKGESSDVGRSIGRLLIQVVSAAGVEPAAMASEFSVQMRIGRSTTVFEDILRGNQQLAKFQALKDPLKTVTDAMSDYRAGGDDDYDNIDDDFATSRGVMVVKAMSSLVSDAFASISEAAKEVVETTVGEKQDGVNGRCVTPAVQCTSGVSVRWDSFFDLDVTDAMVATSALGAEQLLHVQVIYFSLYLMIEYFINLINHIINIIMFAPFSSSRPTAAQDSCTVAARRWSVRLTSPFSTSAKAT